MYLWCKHTRSHVRPKCTSPLLPAVTRRHIICGLTVYDVGGGCLGKCTSYSTEWHVRWHYIYYPDSEKCCFSRVDDIPTSSGAGWKQPLFIFKEQALSLHSNNDNFDKVLLMWDGGCAMRAERQHWMGWRDCQLRRRGAGRSIPPAALFWDYIALREGLIEPVKMPSR
ncbi:hypothetical protein BDV30DRAFT_231303 [Aspergillus minisclerotigenes]|uniref:Uncharacterized protein n=1 Tax=Aspergillus minisclerotigenes TaxID=656917 RepID=A0A5N6ING8_9EURO|nr:hypothetical protein BDV30DRAFT_231303 [Aspergillus minisclerotigenes]